MAKLKLADGRVIPIVKPHLGDQMELERQMKAANKKYGPAQFVEDIKLSGFMNAFALFASLRRAGLNPSIHEILEIDLEQLAQQVEQEPGDRSSIEDNEDGSEDEQTPDPQLAPTGGEDGTADLEPGLSAIS